MTQLHSLSLVNLSLSLVNSLHYLPLIGQLNTLPVSYLLVFRNLIETNAADTEKLRNLSVSSADFNFEAGGSGNTGL